VPPWKANDGSSADPCAGTTMCYTTSVVAFYTEDVISTSDPNHVDGELCGIGGEHFLGSYDINGSELNLNPGKYDPINKCMKLILIPLPEDKWRPISNGVKYPLYATQCYKYTVTAKKNGSWVCPSSSELPAYWSSGWPNDNLSSIVDLVYSPANKFSPHNYAMNSKACYHFAGFNDYEINLGKRSVVPLPINSNQQKANGTIKS